MVVGVHEQMLWWWNALATTVSHFCVLSWVEAVVNGQPFPVFDDVLSHLSTSKPSSSSLPFYWLCLASYNSSHSLQNLFILHSSRQIRPLFRVSVTGRPANVVRMPVRNSPIVRPAASEAILTEREEASADWRTGVGFASEVADQSGPERSASRLSDSPFGWPRPASRLTEACSPPDERIGCSIQQFKSFYILGFCPLFRLWDFVLWDSVLWDFVLWDFVRRDFVLWDFVRRDFVRRDSVLWDFVRRDFVRRDFVRRDFVLWDSVRIPAKHQANRSNRFFVTRPDIGLHTNRQTQMHNPDTPLREYSKHKKTPWWDAVVKSVSSVCWNIAIINLNQIAEVPLLVVN